MLRFTAVAAFAAYFMAWANAEDIAAATIRAPGVVAPPINEPQQQEATPSTVIRGPGQNPPQQTKTRDPPANTFSTYQPTTIGQTNPPGRPTTSTRRGDPGPTQCNPVTKTVTVTKDRPITVTVTKAPTSARKTTTSKRKTTSRRRPWDDDDSDSDDDDGPW